MPRSVIAAMLPLAVLAGSPASLAQDTQRDRIVSGEDVSPPLLQDGDAIDDARLGLAAAGAQAPVTYGYERHLSIHPDLTATDVVTQRLKILVPGAIEKVSQQELSFVEGMQTLDIIEAFTEKADGRRIAVEPANIITRDASSGEQLIYLRDQKARTIIFPAAAAGDTLVYTVRIEHLKPMLGGQFSDVEMFPRTLSFSLAHVVVEAPAKLDLAIKATGDGTTDKVETVGDIVRHDVKILPAAYRLAEAGSVSPLDTDATVTISTFKSYEEIGRAYGDAALAKATVTPEIAAMAEEITGGITDRRAQAIAIDGWMKKNIRYVGVYLGPGRLIPNEAAAVLRNRFGDCKDKATLMAALLAAKGIASEEVLINAANSYRLPEPPAMVAFNHVILYIPDFELYDDPTFSQAAFGVLGPADYDKPVVRVSAAGATLAHTPVMRPDDHTRYVKTTLKFGVDGTISGQTQESNTGVFGAILRASGGNVQSIGDEAAASRYLAGYNTPGSGHIDLGNIGETIDPASVISSFALDSPSKLPLPGERISIPFGLPLTARPGNGLLGSRVNDRELPFVCVAGRQTEDIDATFDAILQLPVPLRPASIDSKVFSYSSSYRIDGRTLKIHREFISRVPEQTCAPELEAQIANDLKAVFVDEYSGFTYGRAPAATAIRPPLSSEVKSVVTASQKRMIDFFSSLNVDCSSGGFADARVVEQPQHGNVAVRHGMGHTNYPQDNPRSECNKRETDGTVVVFEPEAGFSGTDSLTIDVTFPSGTTAKRHYTIAVNLPAAPVPSVTAAQTLQPPVQQASLTPSQPQTLEFARVAAANQRLNLAFLFFLNPDCSSDGLPVVRIPEPPKHGKLTAENGTGFSAFPQNNQRYECNKRKSDGVVVSYNPEPDFLGTDSITLDIIYPNGTTSKRHYAIEVR